MELGVLLAIIFGGVSLLFMAISVPFFMHKKSLVAKCSEKTEGRVIEYKKLAMGDNTRHAITPVVEFDADGKSYRAYRHYRGCKVVSKALPEGKKGEDLEAFSVTEKDMFQRIRYAGMFYAYQSTANALWPLGSTLPVVYNPKKPKQAFVEKVVVVSDIAGIVLLSVGALFLAIAVICFFVG